MYIIYLCIGKQLTSKGNTHDEVDFEFLGNKEGKLAVQTNVFTNGKGNREQKLALWFDPSKDFHTYAILWNPYQIVYVPLVPLFFNEFIFIIKQNLSNHNILFLPLYHANT